MSQHFLLILEIVYFYYDFRIAVIFTIDFADFAE